MQSNLKIIFDPVRSTRVTYRDLEREDKKGLVIFFFETHLTLYQISKTLDEETTKGNKIDPKEKGNDNDRNETSQTYTNG